VNDAACPLVSILIPNYNYAQYVGTAVQSAVDQTYPNVEVLVSDNCSTDGAWELLQERFGSDPRVRLYRNEQNIGMARNFDRLRDLARGAYVLWLSSDDFLMPTHVEGLADVFRRDPTLDVAWCNAYFARDDGTVYSKRALPGEFPVSYVDARDELVENFTTVCPVCFPCALFKRDVLLEPGMCGDPSNGQDARDWEVIIRLALAGKRFGYVARPSMAIRLHGDQFSGEAYHRSGRNVSDFASYVERYMNHPEFVRRMRGREFGVARFLRTLVGAAASMNGGTSPFDEAQRARFDALAHALDARAARYEPALVRESTVSIVLQAAGSPRALLDAMDGLQAQRFDRWEAVVVDHGTIDVEALLRTHPAWKRTSYVRLPAPATPGAARNLALRMARGEYLAFLEIDNRFMPDHLASAVDTVARTGAVATFSGSRLVVERTDGRLTSPERITEVPYGGAASDLAALAVAHTIPLDAFVVYRGALARTGTFNAGVPALDDWDFAIDLARVATCAPTGATTLEVVARIGLIGQRLAGTYAGYVALMDALYAAHPVDAVLTDARVRHRAAVADAVSAARDWLQEPHGVAGFMQTLAGRGLGVQAQKGA